MNISLSVNVSEDIGVREHIGSFDAFSIKKDSPSKIVWMDFVSLSQEILATGSDRVTRAGPLYSTIKDEYEEATILQYAEVAFVLSGAIR